LKAEHKKQLAFMMNVAVVSILFMLINYKPLQITGVLTFCIFLGYLPNWVFWNFLDDDNPLFW
jgi:hypothetical protein